MPPVKGALCEKAEWDCSDCDAPTEKGNIMALLEGRGSGGTGHAEAI